MPEVTSFVRTGYCLGQFSIPLHSTIWDYIGFRVWGLKSLNKGGSIGDYFGEHYRGDSRGLSSCW